MKPKWKIVHRFPKVEPVVSMIEFKGQIIIATSRAIYRLVDDKMIPIPLVKAETE